MMGCRGPRPAEPLLNHKAPRTCTEFPAAVSMRSRFCNLRNTRCAPRMSIRISGDVAVGQSKPEGLDCHEFILFDKLRHCRFLNLSPLWTSWYYWRPAGILEILACAIVCAPTVNLRLQSLQNRNGLSPRVAVLRTPLLTVWLLLQYGHRGLRPRFFLNMSFTSLMMRTRDLINVSVSVARAACISLGRAWGYCYGCWTSPCGSSWVWLLSRNS